MCKHGCRFFFPLLKSCNSLSKNKISAQILLTLIMAWSGSIQACTYCSIVSTHSKTRTWFHRQLWMHTRKQSVRIHINPSTITGLFWTKILTKAQRSHEIPVHSASVERKTTQRGETKACKSQQPNSWNSTNQQQSRNWQCCCYCWFWILKQKQISPHATNQLQDFHNRNPTLQILITQQQWSRQKTWGVHTWPQKQEENGWLNFWKKRKTKNQTWPKCMMNPNCQPCSHSFLLLLLHKLLPKHTTRRWS